MNERGEIMTISEKIEALSEVLSILAQKKCTVDDASLILSQAQKEIRSTATVQDLDYKALLTKAYRHLL